MDEILAAQEEMADLAAQLRAADTARIREEPPSQSTTAGQDS
jgi:hypothetical protein